MAEVLVERNSVWNSCVAPPLTSRPMKRKMLAAIWPVAIAFAPSTSAESARRAGADVVVTGGIPLAIGLMRGMLADLAVLSQDISTVPPPALPATTSVLTMVGGKVVCDANASRIRP
jgi:hypothetical protein